MKRIFLICGEASGDLYGAELIKSLKSQDEDVILQAWGGKHMESVGVHLGRKLDDLAFMGFWDVLKNSLRVVNNIRLFKKQVKDFKPDAIIYIDYAGFNLRMAKWTHKLGIRNYYYILPKTWAWKAGRIKKLKKYTDQCFIILPFERSFYAKYKLPVIYTGHPLVTLIHDFQPNLQFRETHNLNKSPIIALFPGSRKQEVLRILPTMLKIVSRFSDYRFCIAGVAHIGKAYYHSILKASGLQDQVRLILDDSYNILQLADMAIVCSGTASLEAAIFKVPQVVCYKTDFFTYWLGKNLIKIKYLSLVNILLGDTIVEELIQDQFTTERVINAIRRLINKGTRAQIIAHYQHMIELLDDGGGTHQIAEQIFKDLNILER